MNSKYALSLWEPWAWLVIRPDVVDPALRAELLRLHLIKSVENRRWRTSRRGWVAIQSANTIDPDGIAFVKSNFPSIVLPKRYNHGHIIGEVRIVDCVSESKDPWFFGPFGFVLEDATPLPLVPLRGLQLFFPIERKPKPAQGELL